MLLSISDFLQRQPDPRYFTANETDHKAAKKWYTELLVIEPYFSVPGPAAETKSSYFLISTTKQKSEFVCLLNGDK